MGRQVCRRDSGDVEIQDRSLARVNIKKWAQKVPLQEPIELEVG
jgi:hypothetical protein